MKKQLISVAAALVFSVTASTSFAVVPGMPVVDLADSTADLGVYHSMAITQMNLGFGYQFHS
jgi:hypothetical protein